MFFYFQQKGGEDLWQEALAEQRDHIVSNKKPRYVTVLDVSHLIDDSTTKEEILALKYKGPLYFDWDSKDIDDCIMRVQRFIKKLEELEVNLKSVRFYASGGKGFHCEIPQCIFMAKPPAKGTQSLPAIYKEIAYSLYTDTMDLRVYSARKGRMWRTANVERENGRYKVQVTAAEIKDMTEESYVEITSKPRNDIKVAEAEFNHGLSVIYAKAEQKIIAANKRRASTQKDVEALRKFKGAFPETVTKIMNGEALAEGAGFNKIAMQLGITANGLGRSEEDYIALCAGLIEKHNSDGVRYNTPKKREEELRRMYEYTQDNVCYSYSAGALKSLLAPGEAAPDLDGVTEAHGKIEEEDEDVDESLYAGVFLTDKGAYKKTEDGIVQICDLTFANIDLLVDAVDQQVSGFEADVSFKHRTKNRKRLDMDMFMSKGKLVPFVMQNMGAFTGSDSQVNSMAARMRNSAIKNGGVTHTINKEGLDIIRRGTPEGIVTDVVWAATDRVIIAHDKGDVRYVYASKMNQGAIFKSDLMNSPDLKGTEEEAKVIEALLNLNEPYVIGNLLGWMTSCFHRQLYHSFYNQFPIAQVVGQAGSGKSSTVHALMHLFYYTVAPNITSAMSNSKFGIDSQLQNSASIPCVLEEYKPSQFSVAKRGELLTMFREAYNSTTFTKGGGNGNGNWNAINQYSYSAPVLFICESMETETAVLERAVTTSLNKSGISGRGKNMQYVRDHREVLSALGKTIVMATFDTDFNVFREEFEKVSDSIRGEAYKGGNDRVLFNMSVVVTGLQFMAGIVNAIYGKRFDDKFAQLLAAVRDTTSHAALVVMSEAAKVMSILSFMTHTENAQSEYGLDHGTDYWQDDKTLDLKIRNCYIKYTAWCHRKAQSPLYANEDAFAHGLSGFAATIDRAVPNSPLKDSALTKVFKFDKSKLEEEKVEAFR